MTKCKLAPKSWLIPLTTSLCQLLKTLIKKIFIQMQNTRTTWNIFKTNK